MLTVAMTIAVASTVAGTWLAQGLHRETGPLIVTVSAGCFLLSLAKRMHR